MSDITPSPATEPGLDPGAGSVWSSGRIALVLFAAALCAYFNSFSAPMVFDDIPDIQHNPAVLSLWPPSAWMSGILASRPLVTLSLALNYAVSGYEVFSYHVFNFLVHVAAALTLFGVVRRTLIHGDLAPRFGESSRGLALGSALVWMLHPMQVQSVTYIVQRCESLMGLFFLLTLYAAIRGWQARTQWPWHLAALCFCLLGVGSKQVIAAAPVLVFLWDLVFNRRSFFGALRRSAFLYAGFVLCMAVLALLVLKTHAGMLLSSGGDQSVTPWEYARSQPEIILHYLRLAVWPSPLVLDYWWPMSSVGRAIPFAAALAVLVSASLWLLAGRNPVGYLGMWIFVILAITSSGLAPLNLVFEHRMYLPLAALAVLAVVGGSMLVNRVVLRPGQGAEVMAGAKAAARSLSRLALVLLVVALGTATVFRNLDWSSDLSIWTDTAEKRPLNPRAWCSMGLAYHRLGRMEESLAAYEQALAVDPTYLDTYTNLGSAFIGMGFPEEAAVQYEAGLAQPGRRDQHAILFRNLGTAMYQLGRPGGALTCFHESLVLMPVNPEAHNNIGYVFLHQGRFREAEPHLREALALAPRYMDAHLNLGLVLVGLRQYAEAEQHLRLVLAANPDFAPAMVGLGEALEGQGRIADAETAYRRALDMDPANERALTNLRRIMGQGTDEQDGS